jgi:hypothetical protein
MPWEKHPRLAMTAIVCFYEMDYFAEKGHFIMQKGIPSRFCTAMLHVQVHTR